jgi:hypothetical protein
MPQTYACYRGHHWAMNWLPERLSWAVAIETLSRFARANALPFKGPVSCRSRRRIGPAVTAGSTRDMPAADFVRQGAGARMAYPTKQTVTAGGDRRRLPCRRPAARGWLTHSLGQGVSCPRPPCPPWSRHLKISRCRARELPVRWPRAALLPIAVALPKRAGPGFAPTPHSPSPRPGPSSG